MTKTPITWIGLLKEKINLKGKGTSIGDVAPEAKKEWIQIKEGKHPKYTQGKMTKSKSSTKKKGKKSANKTKKNNNELFSMLKKINFCPKCAKEVKKLMKKQKGGDDDSGCAGGSTDAADEAFKNAETEAMTGGSCECGGGVVMTGGNCGCGMTGGKNKKNKNKKSTRKTKKNKQRGGDEHSEQSKDLNDNGEDMEVANSDE